MQTMAVCFSRARSPWMIGSRLIQWLMGRDFSHTYLMYKEDRYVDWTVNQATGHGINYMSQLRFYENNIPVKEFLLNISDELYDRILQDCHANAGVSYGYLQNLGIALVDGLSKIGIKLNRNPINDGINCSEWMDLILQEIYGVWTTKDRNLIRPDDIYDFLDSKHPNL